MRWRGGRPGEIFYTPNGAGRVESKMYWFNKKILRDLCGVLKKSDSECWAHADVLILLWAKIGLSSLDIWMLVLSVKAEPKGHEASA